MPQTEEFEDVIARVIESGQDRAVTDLARTIGAALPHRDLRRLMSLARQCRRAADGSDHSGALTALSELTTTYVTEVAETQKQIDLDLLAERPSLVSVLQSVGDGVDRPSDIATQADIARSTVTKVLNELRQLGLVEEAPPRSGDRRARRYQLTLSGSDAAAAVSTRSAPKVPYLAFSYHAAGIKHITAPRLVAVAREGSRSAPYVGERPEVGQLRRSSPV